MTRRPIDARISASLDSDPESPSDGISREQYREALCHWASGVTIAAVRDGEDIYATTVSSLTSVSDMPPMVLITLTPSAQILPFLDPGVPIGISILAEGQRRTASVFADSYPVGPSPFLDAPVPLVDEALVQLECQVVEMMPVGGSRVVIARITSASVGASKEPLLYYRREFRTLG